MWESVRNPFIRELNVDGVVGKGLKDLGGIMSCVEMKDVRHFPDDLSLTLSLNLNQDVLRRD